MCYSDIIQEIYALVDQSYKDYQRKLKELYGKEAHEKIMDALNVKKAEERYIYGSYMFGECNTYIDEPILKTLFYEPYSDRFFESTIVDVMQAEYRRSIGRLNSSCPIPLTGTYFCKGTGWN